MMKLYRGLKGRPKRKKMSNGFMISANMVERFKKKGKISFFFLFFKMLRKKTSTFIRSTNVFCNFLLQSCTIALNAISSILEEGGEKR